MSITFADDLNDVIRRLRRIEEKLDRRACCTGVTRAQPITDDSARKLAARPVESTDVREVFEHWRKVMQKNGNVKLTNERRRCIQARLKERYSLAEIKQAIDGCAASEFHMARGQYRGQRRYDDLTLILRNGSRLEGFRDNADPAKPTRTDVRNFL